MATRHDCALSREPRSPPLLLLNSGNRIFKPRFRRNTAYERIAEILNRGQFGIGVHARIGKYTTDAPAPRLWKVFDSPRVIAAKGKYVRGPDGERWIDDPRAPEARITRLNSRFVPPMAASLGDGPQP
jgi:hypothetical protein